MERSTTKSFLGMVAEADCLIFYTASTCGVLPDRCSVTEGDRRCVNPPAFVISIVAGDGEYMVGVACAPHRGAVSRKVASLQKSQDIPAGRIRFAPLKAVGTDCINAKPDDLIQL